MFNARIARFDMMATVALFRKTFWTKPGLTQKEGEKSTANTPGCFYLYSLHQRKYITMELYYMSYMHATSIGLKWRNEKKKEINMQAHTARIETAAHSTKWSRQRHSPDCSSKSNCRWNLLIFHHRRRWSVRRNLVSPACSSQKERYPVNSQAKKGTSLV